MFFSVYGNDSTVAPTGLDACMPTMSSFIGSGKISKLYMMLSVLPLPPLPIHFTLDPTDVKNVEIKQALIVAMNSLEGRGVDANKVHNSQSVIAALTLFSDWCEFGKANSEKSKLIKDGLVLRLMKQCLERGNGREDCCVSEQQAYDIFYSITKDWILCSVPAEAKVVISPVSPNVPTFEDPIHIAMSHYAYSQGTLYSAKGNHLICPTHSFVTESLRQKINTASQDEFAFEQKELDDEGIRMQQQEMAEMYSKYSFVKLLSLCFTRIHRDSLLGHIVPGEQQSENVIQTAKSLLEDATQTHRRVLKEKNMPETFDDLPVTAFEPEEGLDVTRIDLDSPGPLQEGKEESQVSRIVTAFVTLCVACLEDDTSFERWVSLAKNFEDLNDLSKTDNHCIASACKMVRIDKVLEVFQPIVSNNQVCNAGMKRLDQALIELSLVEHGNGEKKTTLVSYASELGILVRLVAEDVEPGISAVRDAAQALHASSPCPLEKSAAEFLFELGACMRGDEVSRFEEVD